MKKRGFTLIEVVVVIAIIAILAVVIVASISAARISSRNAANRANGQAVKAAIERYYSSKLRYTVTPNTPWGPTTFSTVTAPTGMLGKYGVNINTVGCANGGGEIQALSDRTYRINIYRTPACNNTPSNIIETIDGP